MNDYNFSEEGKARIKEAVKDLEQVSNGEIVPYFVSSSDDYDEASWYSAAILGLFTLISFGMLSYGWLLPVRITPLEVSAVTTIMMLVGFVFPRIFTKSKRWIVSRDRQLERVGQRALEAFLSENVFATKDRIGILIFLSRLEHRVLVLGDQGINRRVKKEDWQQVVDVIVDGIKKDKIEDGLVHAIGLCKELLLAHGFHRKATDTNELSDGLRIED